MTTLIDISGVHRKVNKKAIDFLGFSEYEIVGRPAKEFIYEDEKENSEEIKALLLADKTIPIYERRFKRKDGSIIYGENDVSLVKDDTGKPLYFFSIVRDVTKRIEEINELNIYATTDPLTQLLNRRSIFEKLNEEKNRFDRNKKTFSIIIADIDNFKLVNDKYGHECGDSVLLNISHKMISNLRKQDKTCRWGGEEFLILLPETNYEGAKVIAEKIQTTISDTNIAYKGNTLSITITQGICEYNGLGSIEDSINCADKSLYIGKNSGKNCVILYKDTI